MSTSISSFLSVFPAQIVLGKGLGKDGLQLKQLLKDGYETVFLGIGQSYDEEYMSI